MPRLGNTSYNVLLYGTLVFLIVSSLAFVYREHGYDDPYITYRYTKNLLQGRGFVYNAGEWVLSTTAPGYALLLAPLGLVFKDIPLLSNIVSAVGLGLGALSLYLWSQQAGQPTTGWIAGLLLLTFPLCILSFGSEFGLYLGTTLAGFHACAKKRPEQAMAWMAAATLIRPDAMLAAGLVAVCLFSTTRRLPWRPIALYLIILLPWILYATWTYGSPLPVTLSAKRAQGRMLISDSYLAGAWKMITDHAQRPFYWLYLPLGMLGIWRIAKKGQTWWLLMAWTVCFFLAYVAMGVTRYFWYYVPLVPGIVLAVAAGVGWIRDHLSSMCLDQRWRVGVTAGLTAMLLVPNVQGLLYLYAHPDPRTTTYREIGEWIDAHLPQEASVGTLEVGIIGYYSQRRIIDFAGLIQPAVHAHMHRQATYQDTATWAVQNFRPTNLLLQSGWFPSWKDTILKKCRPLHIFTWRGRKDGFALYECEWSE